MSDRLPEDLLPDPLFVHTGRVGDVETVVVSVVGGPVEPAPLRRFAEVLRCDRGMPPVLELVEVVTLK